MNAVEIEEAVSQLVSQPFDPGEFPFAFLEAYGNKETTVKRLRKGNSNKSKMEGGVLQRNNIHIATCEPGAVANTLRQLQEAPETTKNKAKFVLATDGEELQAENLNSGETLACAYPDFHQHFTFFFELAGISTVKEIRESSFDIKATGRLNKLYMELLRANPDWATPERKQDMNHFMARLIFCFFAEDTNIFEGDNLFTGTVEQMSAPDASNMHEIIGELFRAMDVKAEEREAQGIRTWARKFPYVNGELFSGATDCPRFTKIARSYLLHVGRLDWQQINPDIFGSMIQAVADEDERGSLGMHYTSVPNILKVLNPLFLDELREQLEEAGDNARKLLNLRKRIARIRVFDPACGSGNFLVIAYKQLREIENEINRRRGEPDRPTEIPLTNFRGIEIKGFSAEIARLALIIAEYQCDVLYLGQQLALAEFLPLDAENWITCGNALRINWLTVCPPTGTGVELGGDDLFSAPEQQANIDFENEGGETFICGNPPYLGSTWQSKEQKSDLKAIFEKYTKTWKSLDYVAGWFMKAAEYGTQTNAASAFVSTNSICQGQQVPILWPLIFKKKHEISFAHTSFKWANLASYNAGVTVVIVGIAEAINRQKRLFSVDDNDLMIEKRCDNINAYLIAAPNVIVKQLFKPIDSRPKFISGNVADDAGALIANTREDFSPFSAEAEYLIRPFVGSSELIKGKPRYCLWVEDTDLAIAKRQKGFVERFKRVEKKRTSPKAGPRAKAAASIPYKFAFRSNQDTKALVIPRVSSENRPYLPVGIVNSHIVLGDRNFALYDAPLWNLALIASRLHWVWIGTVCVRMRTDFSYSNTLGWNTFPLPKLTTKNKEDLTRCAEDILLTRERHFPATIADLYDPEKMPEDLRHAHERNDEVLERIYIGRRFKNDTERLEKLFELYTEMTAKEKTA
jgi:hypothetical protein